MTTQLLMDRAYAALQSTMGDVKGWEQIEPTRVYIPLRIQRMEERLVEANEHLNMCAELNEQARTDLTSEYLGDAVKAVAAINAELEFMIEMWREHPDAFDEDEVVTP